MPWNIKWTGQICIDVNELRIAISMQWSLSENNRDWQKYWKFIGCITLGVSSYTKLKGQTNAMIILPY